MAFATVFISGSAPLPTSAALAKVNSKTLWLRSNWLIPSETYTITALDDTGTRVEVAEGADIQSGQIFLFKNDLDADYTEYRANGQMYTKMEAIQVANVEVTETNSVNPRRTLRSDRLSNNATYRTNTGVDWTATLTGVKEGSEVLVKQNLTRPIGFEYREDEDSVLIGYGLATEKSRTDAISAVGQFSVTLGGTDVLTDLDIKGL